MDLNDAAPPPPDHAAPRLGERWVYGVFALVLALVGLGALPQGTSRAVGEVAGNAATADLAQGLRTLLAGATHADERNAATPDSADGPGSLPAVVAGTSLPAMAGGGADPVLILPPPRPVRTQPRQPQGPPVPVRA